MLVLTWGMAVPVGDEELKRILADVRRMEVEQAAELLVRCEIKCNETLLQYI